ncbi:MAG TPA: type II 3-dehydroquinate dehydratase [Lysobacter sp.]|nr:type II 3-dehydroquinate dehydratase [Lysobacter sp.]
MAIVMIQGPNIAEGRKPADTVQVGLTERAQSAGHVLLHYRCGTEEQLAERLARIDRGQADIILLDPGRCATPDGPLHRTLNHLQVPYIEVHDDSFEHPEPVIPDGAGPRVAVVNGYRAQSYTLAMSMALEQLGCADSENDFNVGT